MSMDPDQESFQRLRQLMALKRHEQPPPGYFNRFHQQVIERLQAGERPTPDELFVQPGREASWLQRLWAALEAKPIVAGAFGAAVCAVLVTGIVYSQSVDPSPVTVFMPGAESAGLAAQNDSQASPLLTRAIGLELARPVSLGGAQVRGPLFPELRQSQSFFPQSGAEPVKFTRQATGN